MKIVVDSHTMTKLFNNPWRNYLDQTSSLLKQQVEIRRHWSLKHSLSKTHPWVNSHFHLSLACQLSDYLVGILQKTRTPPHEKITSQRLPSP